MRSAEHNVHLARNVAHNNCPECRADCERQFVGGKPFKYAQVPTYLEWIRPRLAAIREGDNSIPAQQWHRDFLRALHRRISSHLQRTGRKQCHSYLERIWQFRDRATGQWRCHDAGYLREFVRKGASCLDVR